MFDVSQAKRELLTYLVEDDWAPSELADELDRSTATIYNHLEDLVGAGVLTTYTVPAKTRPKTKYTIGDGAVQYIAVLPGLLHERSLEMSEYPGVLFRIWSIPQDEVHHALTDYIFALKHDGEVAFHDDIAAIGVYGSVARGHARPDSDIDLLVICTNPAVTDYLEAEVGSILLSSPEGDRMAMTTVFTRSEYRNSLAHDSDFLASVLDEIHPLYDPGRLFSLSPEVLANE